MSLVQTLGIPLYDDIAVSYDLLRFHTALIMKQSVREVLSPYTLFARNHITTQNECVVRMSHLHLNPWLSMYANPDNAIVLDDNYPLLPVDIVEQWNTPKIDNTVVNLSNKPGQFVQMATSKTHDRLPLIDQVQPIDVSKISIPDNNLAILNFAESPEQLRLRQQEPERMDNFCMRNVTLSVQLNTNANFKDNVIQGEQNGDDYDTSELLRRLESGGVAGKSSPTDGVISSRPAKRDELLDFLKY